MAPGPAAPLRRNRFARYPKTTIALTVVVLLGAVELASYAVIRIKGHSDLRFQYRYNRILSGYTVFKNVPNHSFRTSAIKSDPGDPDPVLDEHGFLCDEPLTVAKPAGTIRVFLIGGSTAFGAGQNAHYHEAHSYPDGLYAYPASIAGRLKAYLEGRKPGSRYQVVNAAGYERRIHQSFIQYVQSLTRFHPDLIVNLEGMNDVYSIISGSPFDDVEKQLPFYVELSRRPHSPLNYSATYYVLSTAYEKWVNRRGRKDSSAEERAPGTTSAAPAGDAAQLGHASGSPPTEYEKKKAEYRKNCEPLLRVLNEYFAGLKADGTRCIFGLQPLLHRQKANKRLSAIEQRLVGVLAPRTSDAAARPDESTLLITYFYDDFLSGAIRDIAAKFNVTYIDFNAEIAGLGPDVEFYTDYCHLTPQGNQRVAEILGRAILAEP